MPFARFGRMAACGRGRSEENLTQWPRAKGNGIALLSGRICGRLQCPWAAARRARWSRICRPLPRSPCRSRTTAASSPTTSGQSSPMWRLSETSKFPGCGWSITSRVRPGSPVSRSTRTGNRKTMPCSFRATRLSTRASASSSINATSRRLSLSTCRRLPPRKRLARDVDLFDELIDLDLAPDRAPEWHAIAKAYVAQPGLLHQRPDLGLRHAMLEPCAEAVERVGAHGIVATPAIGAERPIRDIAAQSLEQPSPTRQWPVDAGGKKFGNRRLQAKGRLRKRVAQEVARSPQQAKPRRPILEGVIDIHEHRRSTLELVHARGEAGRGIGQVVEHAKAVTEIHAVVGQRHGIER